MRIDGPTPNGGSYSEMFLFDVDDNIVSDRGLAIRGVVRECAEDGTLISTTWFKVGGNSG